jgi:hypothetical protein
MIVQQAQVSVKKKRPQDFGKGPGFLKKKLGLFQYCIFPGFKMIGAQIAANSAPEPCLAGAEFNGSHAIFFAAVLAKVYHFCLHPVMK